MTRCCEIRDVSVKATSRSESGAVVNLFALLANQLGWMKMKAIVGTEVRSVFRRRSQRLTEGSIPARARKFADDMRVGVTVERTSLGPNQPSEPTRPAVRFRECVLRFQITSCSGLLAQL